MGLTPRQPQHLPGRGSHTRAARLLPEHFPRRLLQLCAPAAPAPPRSQPNQPPAIAQVQPEAGAGHSGSPRRCCEPQGTTMGVSRGKGAAEQGKRPVSGKPLKILAPSLGNKSKAAATRIQALVLEQKHRAEAFVPSTLCSSFLSTSHCSTSAGAPQGGQSPADGRDATRPGERSVSSEPSPCHNKQHRVRYPAGSLQGGAPMGGH